MVVVDVLVTAGLMVALVALVEVVGAVATVAETKKKQQQNK